MKKVGIVGGSGYAGVELLRILLLHPSVEVELVCSRAHSGSRVDQLFPNLRGATELAFKDPAEADFSALDLVFYATPNCTAMHVAEKLLDSGVKLVDLSADFRLKDIAVWEQWYGAKHAAPHLLETAVYGLPEFHREAIKEASLVANPGCYPTCIQLGFLPLLEAGLVDCDSIIADAKSGVSGAGRSANVNNLLAEVSDSFKAYASSGHRHLPEIEQGLQTAIGKSVNLTFTPHLLPVIRGIHATLYMNLLDESVTLDAIQQLYESRYRDEIFVDVMPPGSHPETRSVRGSNICRLAIARPQGRNRIVVLAVEDNLVKGAAGQAVQNMNLMLGFDEAQGLQTLALLP